MAFNNLKAEMARMGFTQVDVAKAMGRSTKTANSVINEQIGLSIKQAQTIRDALFPEMTIDYLFKSY